MHTHKYVHTCRQTHTEAIKHTSIYAHTHTHIYAYYYFNYSITLLIMYLFFIFEKIITQYIMNISQSYFKKERLITTTSLINLGQFQVEIFISVHECHILKLTWRTENIIYIICMKAIFRSWNGNNVWEQVNLNYVRTKWVSHAHTHTWLVGRRASVGSSRNMHAWIKAPKWWGSHTTTTVPTTAPNTTQGRR